MPAGGDRQGGHYFLAPQLPNPPSPLIYSENPKNPKEFHHANHLATMEQQNQTTHIYTFTHFSVFVFL